VFSNLFFITLPNIKKYFPGIHFSKGNYFPANKWSLKKKGLLEANNCKNNIGEDSELEMYVTESNGS